MKSRITGPLFLKIPMATAGPRAFRDDYLFTLIGRYACGRDGRGLNQVCHLLTGPPPMRFHRRPSASVNVSTG
jgi:hypothetical protein